MAMNDDLTNVEVSLDDDLLAGLVRRGYVDLSDINNPEILGRKLVLLLRFVADGRKGKNFNNNKFFRSAKQELIALGVAQNETRTKYDVVSKSYFPLTTSY